MAVTGPLLLPVQKNTVKHSVQCHVLVQSLPGRRPNDKYPVNTSHRSDLCKYVSLQCYSQATVIHIQSVRRYVVLYIYIYIYIYTFFRNTGALVGKSNTKLGRQRMLFTKEILARAILGMRAVGSVAILYRLQSTATRT